VLSALGLASADRRRDAVRTVLMDEADLRAGRARDVLSELAREAAAGLPGASIETTFDMRYAGQAFELPVGAPPDAPLEALRDRFERAHAERYGYSNPRGALEVVNLRVAATAGRPALVTVPAQRVRGAAQRSRREADFAGERLTAAVVRGTPAPGERLEGPTVLELEEATVVVPPGWRAAADDHDAIVIERARDGVRKGRQ